MPSTLCATSARVWGVGITVDYSRVLAMTTLSNDLKIPLCLALYRHERLSGFKHIIAWFLSGPSRHIAGGALTFMEHQSAQLAPYGFSCSTYARCPMKRLSLAQCMCKRVFLSRLEVGCAFDTYLAGDSYAPIGTPTSTSRLIEQRAKSAFVLGFD